MKHVSSVGALTNVSQKEGRWGGDRGGANVTVNMKVCETEAHPCRPVPPRRSPKTKTCRIFSNDLETGRTLSGFVLSSDHVGTKICLRENMTYFMCFPHFRSGKCSHHFKSDTCHIEPSRGDRFKRLKKVCHLGWLFPSAKPTKPTPVAN